MHAADQEGPPPPGIVCLSPTEMTGDWVSEVKQKLVAEGFDSPFAERLAGAVEAEMQPFAAKCEAERRPSLWRRMLWFLGLSD